MLEDHKLGEIENAARSLEKILRDGDRTKPFGMQWDAVWWLKWATIHHAFRTLEIPEGARVLELGSGTGWATLLLAEAGHVASGIDLAPGNVEIANRHAERWGNEASFSVGDMENLAVDEEFDAVLIFDALHHLAQPQLALSAAVRALKPGGWVLLGEPSFLHRLSPEARRVHRDKAWIENGFTRRELKKMCRQAGLISLRHFIETSRPFERRARGFLWETARLMAASLSIAPQYSVWIAGRRPPTGARLPSK